MRKQNRSIKRKSKNLSKNKSRRFQTKNRKVRKAAFKMVIKRSKNMSAKSRRLKKQKYGRKSSKKMKRGRKQKGGYISSIPAPLPCSMDTDPNSTRQTSVPDWSSTDDAAREVGVCGSGLKMLQDAERGEDMDDADILSDDTKEEAMVTRPVGELGSVRESTMRDKMLEYATLLGLQNEHTLLSRQVAAGDVDSDEQTRYNLLTDGGQGRIDADNDDSPMRTIMSSADRNAEITRINKLDQNVRFGPL